jgi:hypothetical protein
MTAAAVVTPPAATPPATVPAAQAATPPVAAAPATPPATPPAGDPPAAPPATPPAAQPPAGTPPAAAAPERVVPSEYQLALQQGTILEASDLADVAAMAKQQGLTQEEAQAALVAYEQSLRDQSTKFRSELEADTTLGGANLATTQRNVIRALDSLAPASTVEGKALRTFLDKSGLGNSLHIVRLLDKVGRGMGEDRPILTNAPQGSSPVDIVELFYGKQQ